MYTNVAYRDNTADKKMSVFFTLSHDSNVERITLVLPWSLLPTQVENQLSVIFFLMPITFIGF